MTPSREKLLNRVRQHSLEHNEPLFIELMNEAGEYIENVNQLMNDSDWLTREGYIFHPASGCGYLVLELTEKGEKFFLKRQTLNEVKFLFILMVPPFITPRLEAEIASALWCIMGHPPCLSWRTSSPNNRQRIRRLLTIY